MNYMFLTCVLCVVICAQPLAIQISNLTRFLDAQGILSRGIHEELEEGEIPTPESLREIAKQLGVNPSKVTVIPTVPESPPRDVDQVVIESVPGEEYTNYSSPNNQDIPNFQDLVNERVEEELKGDNAEAAAENADKDEDVVRQTVKSRINEHKSWFKPDSRPQYSKCYNLIQKNSGICSGKIISWGYFVDLRNYGVKRETGVQYFGLPNDLQSLPYFDLHQLARLKCLYSETNGLAGFFERQLKYEFRHGWKVITPQLPKIVEHPTRKHSVTGKPVKINVYPTPKTVRLAHLRKMPQDLSDNFRFWFYDYTTTEAVIVVGKESDVDDWKGIRVFDPMWLRNLSKRDIETLHKSPIIFDEQDKIQALHFQAVVRVCYEYLVAQA